MLNKDDEAPFNSSFMTIKKYVLHFENREPTELQYIMKSERIVNEMGAYSVKIQDTKRYAAQHCALPNGV